MMTPLNITAMADSYANTFQLERNDAVAMARMTRGYSFAFQVLGYFTWEKDGDYKAAVSKSKLYLAEMAYDKIWSELSVKDRQVMLAIAKLSVNGKAAVLDVRNTLDMNGNLFNQYRNRLIKAGLVDGSEHGWVAVTLPFFEQYALESYGE